MNDADTLAPALPKPIHPRPMPGAARAALNDLVQAAWGEKTRALFSIPPQREDADLLLSDFITAAESDALMLANARHLIAQAQPILDFMARRDFYQILGLWFCDGGCACGVKMRPESHLPNCPTIRARWLLGQEGQS